MTKEAHTTKLRGMASIVRIRTASTNSHPIHFLPKVLADNAANDLTNLSDPPRFTVSSKVNPFP